MGSADFVAIGGIIINLLALLIAVSRVLAAGAATEVRTAERFIRLETKTERVEADVQALFRVTSKRRDSHKSDG